MNFKDKIALVTGGTSGIGKQIVIDLLKEGARVITIYHENDEAKDELIKESNSDSLIVTKVDVSKEEDIKKVMKEIEGKFKKLDYLINNAGTNTDGWIESFDIEKWKKVIDTNLVGQLVCIKNSIPLLKKSNSPSIVNIASRLGINPCPESSAYCASKAGVISLTKASAIELSKYNIRVNSVSPGLTMTPLALDGWSKEEIQEIKNKNPLKRLGKTTDTSNTVMFLLSDKASYITGENINVNGGSLI